MRTAVIPLLLAAVLLVTGCDAFRRLAGRPTAAELQAKKEHVLMEREAARQAVRDSIEKVRADSLLRVQEALDSLETLRTTGQAKSSRGLLAEAFPKRYAVVLGAFSVPENATRFAEKVKKAGYDARTVAFRNGRTAVYVNPTDREQEAFDSMEKVRQEDFCPQDVWILVNE